MNLPVADRLDLSDLVHRYAAAIDDRDVDAAVGLFATGAELVLPEPPDTLAATRSHRRRPAIAAALAAVTSVGRTHHSIDGEVFGFGADPSIARGRIAATAHHFGRRADGITDLVWYLRYDDDYVRTDAGWRIDRRALTIDAIETGPVRRLR